MCVCCIWNITAWWIVSKCACCVLNSCRFCVGRDQKHLLLILSFRSRNKFPFHTLNDLENKQPSEEFFRITSIFKLRLMWRWIHFFFYSLKNFQVYLSTERVCSKAWIFKIMISDVWYDELDWRNDTQRLKPLRKRVLMERLYRTLFLPLFSRLPPSHHAMQCVNNECDSRMRVSPHETTWKRPSTGPRAPDEHMTSDIYSKQKSFFGILKIIKIKIQL